MTPTEMLAAVARLIESHGWCQGRYSDEDGRLCVLGAFRRLPGGQQVGALSAALEAVYLEVEGETEDGQVGTWNDQPGRTKEEVIAMVQNAKRHL